MHVKAAIYLLVSGGCLSGPEGCIYCHGDEDEHVFLCPVEVLEQFAVSTTGVEMKQIDWWYGDMLKEMIESEDRFS